MKENSKSISNTPELWIDHWPKLDPSSHKYTRGHSMIVGGERLTGATRLSALAAARVGSGLTSLLVPESSLQHYAPSMLSILVKPYANLASFSDQIQFGKVNAFLIGPGAGASQITRAQVLTLLETEKPVVLDADAINVFQNDLNSLNEAILSPCVLTPHAGEFQRLFPLSDNRLESAQNAAKACNAIIVLKGAETIIAAPNGNVIINRDAPPTLATGGSGDVLAGLITGLIAQGMPAFEAAAAANWIQTEAAKLFGHGLIADDLPGLVPQVLNQLLK